MQKEKSKAPLSGILPLSGTQEVAGVTLRGKMAAEGKKSEARSPLSGTFWAWAFVIFCNSRIVYKDLHVLGLGIFGRNEANTLSSTPLKEDLGCSGYLFTFLGFYLSFFHCYSSSFTMNMVN